MITRKIEPHFTMVKEDHPRCCFGAVHAIQHFMEVSCVCLPDEKAIDYVYYQGIGWQLAVVCTQAAYDRFVEVIEARFPGLCKFEMYK